jgi:hypothetical protein
MRRFRIGSVLALTGLLLSFMLSVYLKDPTPFTVVAPVAIGGKWAESMVQRYRAKPEPEAA